MRSGRAVVQSTTSLDNRKQGLTPRSPLGGEWYVYHRRVYLPAS